MHILNLNWPLGGIRSIDRILMATSRKLMANFYLAVKLPFSLARAAAVLC